MTTEGNTEGKTAGKGTPEQGVTGEVSQDRFVAGQDLTRWKSPVGRVLAGGAEKVTSLLGPYAALIITLVVGLAIALSLALVFGEVYESVTEADGVAGLDDPVLAAAKSVRSPALDMATTAYTNIGGTVGMPIIAVGIMIFLATRRRSWTPVILMLSAGLGSLIITILGKPIFGRSRPDMADAIPPYEHSASFPSGHSLNSIVIAGIVAYLIILRLKTTKATGHHGGGGGSIRLHHGPEPGLFGPPLADGRLGGVGHRHRLAGAGHHGASPVPDGENTTSQRDSLLTPARSLGLTELRMLK